MADKPTNRERLQEITAGIEQGIKELFESEKYMRYLSVMSKFHRYSVNNTMLIYMQRPDATLAWYHHHCSHALQKEDRGNEARPGYSCTHPGRGWQGGHGGKRN